MRKTLLIVALLFANHFLFAQNVVNLFNKANTFFTLLEQNKYEEAHQYFEVAEQAKISPDNLKQLWANVKNNLNEVVSLEAIQSKIQGEYYVVLVSGEFKNGDQNFSLVFNKAEKMVGFFMPPKPVSYINPAYADSTLYTEKMVYLKSGTHQLAAMVTVPKNATNFPIVVLVHGSGPSDMDETVGVNKPFKDIALGLAAKGVASLRYVKRTLIYANEFGKLFTVKEEVLDDAVAAIAFAKTVKDVDTKSIYVLGHSLGGMLAPRIATLAPEIKGLILAAAPARKLGDLIIEQNKYMFALANDTTKAGQQMLANVLVEVEKSKLDKLGNIKPDSLILGLPAAYLVDLNQYDQLEVAKKLKQRILVLQGGNDFQVSAIDYKLWESTLAENANAKTLFYPSLNHLLSFQTEKGTMQQYQKPANVSEQLLIDIVAWITEK